MTRRRCSVRWPPIRPRGGYCPMWMVRRWSGYAIPAPGRGSWPGRTRWRPTGPCRVRRRRASRSLAWCWTWTRPSSPATHLEKESATRTWKTYGYHPLFCFVDGPRESQAALLREGRAGSNTTADRHHRRLAQTRQVFSSMVGEAHLDLWTPPFGRRRGRVLAIIALLFDQPPDRPRR